MPVPLLPCVAEFSNDHCEFMALVSGLSFYNLEYGFMWNMAIRMRGLHDTHIIRIWSIFQLKQKYAMHI